MSNAKESKKIWVDLDNLPHVSFFKPILGQLHSKGYQTVRTVRTCFQVFGLADLRGLDRTTG